ncbi:MAG: helix-turn-helix domain-containing protein [Actinophytocola sp.]|uniref:helix-turn-helix domain-containing protein n=1 Tax=Actinophytocola sp. TaxID=1872138 RepID=UPI0013285C05|nr:helix-turn-helix domain-containing protein [Actinophytocola sp.]MPZ79888.1 helix-turn-helix domain-containing protein [Actinophytocola sp.]
MATKARGARPTRTEDQLGPKSANYHTHALTRGLVLLDLLASVPPPLTLTGMHEHTGLPKSTLVRLLSALTEMRFVVRVDERPAYRLGHKVMALADAYVSSLDLSAAAGTYLDALSKQTQQTSNLGMLDGTEVVHVCAPPTGRCASRPAPARGTARTARVWARCCSPASTPSGSPRTCRRSRTRPAPTARSPPSTR